MFYRTWNAYINKITFQIGYFTRQRTTSQENRNYCAICNQVLQYAVLNNGRLNYVYPETPVPRINHQQMTGTIFKRALLTLKQVFFDIE